MSIDISEATEDVQETLQTSLEWLDRKVLFVCLIASCIIVIIGLVLYEVDGISNSKYNSIHRASLAALLEGLLTFFPILCLLLSEWTVNDTERNAGQVFLCCIPLVGSSLHIASILFSGISFPLITLFKDIGIALFVLPTAILWVMMVIIIKKSVLDVDE